MVPNPVCKSLFVWTQPCPDLWQLSVFYLIPKAPSSPQHIPYLKYPSVYCDSDLNSSIFTAFNSKLQQHIVLGAVLSLEEGRAVSSYMPCHGGGRGVKPKGLGKPSVLSRVKGFGYCIIHKLSSIIHR